MIKRISIIIGVIIMAGGISGCSLASTSSTGNKKVGGVLKSENSGVDWQFKNEAGNGKNIANLEVLIIATDPSDKKRVYLGTKNKGIALTENGAADWVKLKFPAETVYGLAINPYNTNIIYAAGVRKKRGKVYKSIDRGENWKEIYSEPADGTKITSLAIDNQNPQTIFIGSSEGVILRTKDGGISWKNVYSADSTISQIVFSATDTIYFVVYKKELLVSNRTGNKFKKIDKKKLIDGITTIELDQKNQILYIGMSEGLFKMSNNGNVLEEVPILTSAKKYPIRAIAVNPRNSQDIIFSAAQVIYHSIDGGEQWSTFQLDTQRVVANISFIDNSQDIYAGLRNFSSKKGLLGI